MATMRTGSALGKWRKDWPLVATTTMGMSLAALLSAVFGEMLAPMEEELG